VWVIGSGIRLRLFDVKLECSGRQPYVLLYKRIQRILYDDNNTRTFPSAPASGKCTHISKSHRRTQRRDREATTRTTRPDRHAHFEPKFKQYQQEIDDQIDAIYTEFNELVGAKPTTNNQNDKGKGVENQRTILSTITRGYQSDRDDHGYQNDRDDHETRTTTTIDTTTTDTTPVMSAKFKVPKPRTYTGDDGDRDAATLDAWIQKLKDYFKLSGIQDNQNKVLIMQYFLEGTAEDFYHTKRLANTSLDFEQLLTDLRAHIVPSTEINRYWDDWYKINQVRNGGVDRITTTAIRMEKAAARLGEAITNAVKIQRFLDAMHPELRYAVEPDIQDRSKATWDEVKKLAERKDAALFQAGRYGHQQSYSSDANAPQWKNNDSGRQFQRLTDEEKAQLRNDRKCFYCKKPGHIVNDCRARQRNQLHDDDDDDDDDDYGS
jgi:hypothetical protein